MVRLQAAATALLLLAGMCARARGDDGEGATAARGSGAIETSAAATAAATAAEAAADDDASRAAFDARYAAYCARWNKTYETPAAYDAHRTQYAANARFVASHRASRQSSPSDDDDDRDRDDGEVAAAAAAAAPAFNVTLDSVFADMLPDEIADRLLSPPLDHAASSSSAAADAEGAPGDYRAGASAATPLEEEASRRAAAAADAGGAQRLRRGAKLPASVDWSTKANPAGKVALSRVHDQGQVPFRFIFAWVYLYSGRLPNLCVAFPPFGRLTKRSPLDRRDRPPNDARARHTPFHSAERAGRSSRPTRSRRRS